MSKFLDDLKKAADEGEFNSDVAKKINEINELADKKVVVSDEGKTYVETPTLDKINDEVKKNVEPISEEKVLELNSEYEKKMEAIKKQDAVNAQLATLIEIEDMVKASVEDMFSFTEELEVKFEKEFEAKESIFGDLYQKIEQIKSKYKSIIN